MSTTGLLASNGKTIFLPVAVMVVIPVALFLLAQDIRTLTAIQAWRVIGFAMLMLYAFDYLPTLFALPAGLGDVAVGLLAVYALAQLNRDPDYAMSPALVRFHLLGLADFVVAVVTAGLAAGAIPALVGNGITTGAMDVWPMNLFPSFGVPVFIILQITAPLKIRELRRRAPSGYVGRLATA